MSPNFSAYLQYFASKISISTEEWGPESVEQETAEEESRGSSAQEYKRERRQKEELKAEGNDQKHQEAEV